MSPRCPPSAFQGELLPAEPRPRLPNSECLRQQRAGFTWRTALMLFSWWAATQGAALQHSLFARLREAEAYSPQLLSHAHHHLLHLP